MMGEVVSILDMRNSVLAYGAPELSLLSAVLTKMARHIGLAMWKKGGVTDSELMQKQTGVEGTVSILFAGLSGAVLVRDVGFIESALTGSL